MALDRTVSVKLKADIAGYVAGIKQAGAQTSSFAQKLEQGAVKNKAHLDTLGNALLGVGAVAAIGVGAAVKSFADFDQSMSRVEAATHESAAGMDLLRDAAIDAGARTVFSATEAAGAEEALAKAGVSTADILGGALNGALDLASAGTLGVSDAAEIAATAMTQFGLAGSDVPHIADLLAAAAGKAQGEVSDMGVALKYVGPVAHQMGISIEETSGTIAELASNGILADQAGTSLRGILSSLTSPSAAAADEMKKLGIQVYDAQGNFVGFEGVAGQLQTKMSGLDNATRDAALGTIFGNQQITAARILYAGGAEDVRKWTNNVNDAGFAQETAATKLDNLKGDLEQLRGSLSTLLIETGKGSNDFLRGATQNVTKFVNLLGDLPDPAKNATLGVGAVVAAVALLAGGGIKAVQTLAGMKTALNTLGTTAGAVGIKVGIAGLAFAAVGAGIALWANQHAKAVQNVKDLTQAIIEDNLALGEHSRAAVVAQLADSGLLKDAQTLGINVVTLTDAFLGNAAAQEVVNAHTVGAAHASSALGQTVLNTGFLMDGHTAAATRLSDAMSNNTGTMHDATEAARLEHDALGDTVDATGKATKATSTWNDSNLHTIQSTTELADAQQAGAEAAKAGAEAAQAESSALDDLVASMRLLNNESIGAAEAEDNFKDSLAGLTKEVKDNGKSLSDNTVKGRANRGALRDLIKEAEAHAEAVARQTGSVDKANASFDKDISKLRQAAIQTGLSKAEVDKLIGSYARMPAAKSTDIRTPGMDSALAKTRGFRDYLRQLPASKRAAISAPGAAGAAAEVRALRDYINQLHDRAVSINVTRNERHKNGDPGVAATGGYITGPGGPRSDSVPMWLSNGEFVINAAATAAHRSLLEAINSGQFQGMARGGVVQRAPAPVTSTSGQPAAASWPVGRQIILNGDFNGYTPKQVVAEINKQDRDAAAMAFYGGG